MKAKSPKPIVKSKTNWKKLTQGQVNNAPINYSDNPATTQDFWKDAQIVHPNSPLRGAKK